MMMQGSLQHLPAITDNPMSLYGYSNWDRLIACRDIGVQSKGHLNQSRAEMAEMDGVMPTASHFGDPVNLSDPLFFHPQHPRSLQSFDIEEYGYGHPPMGGKSPAIPQKLYPTYQLPGLSYGVRPDGSVLVGARYNHPAPNKRSMDAVQQEVAAGVPNKKRRLTDPAN